MYMYVVRKMIISNQNDKLTNKDNMKNDRTCVAEHIKLRCDSYLYYHLPVTNQSTLSFCSCGIELQVSAADR